MSAHQVNAMLNSPSIYGEYGLISNKKGDFNLYPPYAAMDNLSPGSASPASPLPIPSISFRSLSSDVKYRTRTSSPNFSPKSDLRASSPGREDRASPFKPTVLPMIKGSAESAFRATIGVGHLGLWQRTPAPARIDVPGSNVFPFYQKSADKAGSPHGLAPEPIDAWLEHVPGAAACSVGLRATEFKRVGAEEQVDTPTQRKAKLRMKADTRTSAWNGQSNILAMADPLPPSRSPPTPPRYDGPYSFEASNKRPLFGQKSQATDFGVCPYQCLTGWNVWR